MQLKKKLTKKEWIALVLAILLFGLGLYSIIKVIDKRAMIQEVDTYIESAYEQKKVDSDEVRFNLSNWKHFKRITFEDDPIIYDMYYDKKEKRVHVIEREETP